jgi:hypothetical protein
MATTLDHPYKNLQGHWARGSFHGHCSENSACASVPLAESVRRYRQIGAGFMTLTDHDMVTDLKAMQAAYTDLAFLHGFEYSTRENVIFVGQQVDPLYKLSLEEALGRAGHLLTVVCHPQPYGAAREYWTMEKLEALGTWPDGLEIYNGHYGIEQALAMGRQPLYTPFWDELLTAGHRLWGFANDDFHDLDDFSNAFNMILVEEITPQAITQAAKQGRSYATTGLLLESIQEQNGHIFIEVDAPCQGVFIGPGGKKLAHHTGTQFEYNARDEAYIRFEAEGETGRIFLQPMFKG